MSSKTGGPFATRVLSSEVKHDSGMEVFGKVEFHIKSCM